MYTVRLIDADVDLLVPPAVTILDQALADDINYPHGCRHGRCGACKSRLVEGEVDLLPHTPFSLTVEERKHGLILACRALPRTDCRVSWLAGDIPNHPVRSVSAKVESIEAATHEINIVRLALKGPPLKFSAGQYVELTFGNCRPRPYSMATRPGTTELEFHIRSIPGGNASSHVATRLRPGDQVQVHGPFGIAHLRSGDVAPIIAIAGSSGLAPIISIIETAIQLGMRQAMDVYFAGREDRDIYLEARFDGLRRTHPALNFHAILSRETRVSRRSGRIPDIVADDLPDLSGHRAYLAGSPRLVEAATERLVLLGLPPARVHADAFHAAADQPVAAL